MELPKRGQKPEWNLNTIIQLVTLIGMCAGGVAIWVNKGRDIEELQNWKAGHELLTVRNRQRMPFSTRRSSTRATPRGLLGNNGDMIDHSWSVSS